jgi:hypothetical protein
MGLLSGVHLNMVSLLTAGGFPKIGVFSKKVVPTAEEHCGSVR